MKRRSRTMKQAVFLLAAIVILSGCVGQTVDTFKSMMDFTVSGGGVEDTTITAKIPEFARKDGNFSWQVVVQPTIDIQNFRLSVYDRGFFTVNGVDEFMVSPIKANTTKIFSIAYVMGDSGLTESTDIKMRSSYKSNFSMSSTVAVLKEVEYFQRKAQNKLGEIPLTSWSSVNPLKITVSWSDDMPLLENQEVQMYVDYENGGTGFVETLNPGDVMFTVPSNLKFSVCNDYELNGDKMVLKQPIEFVQKKGKKSTCTFTAKAGSAIDSRMLLGTALYNYELDSTVTVPIIQK